MAARRSIKAARLRCAPARRDHRSSTMSLPRFALAGLARATPGTFAASKSLKVVIVQTPDAASRHKDRFVRPNARNKKLPARNEPVVACRPIKSHRYPLTLNPTVTAVILSRLLEFIPKCPMLFAAPARPGQAVIVRPARGRRTRAAPGRLSRGYLANKTEI
jgi:hypothetical protein